MLLQQPILLSTAYLPPVQYISKFLHDAPVYLESQENYQKQSYRNRCYIYGANGRKCLVIPVKKKHGEKTPVTLVEIDYQYSWQKIHMKSIESAYRLSPFFEYYADEFNACYNREIPSLFNWNLGLLKVVLKFLNISEIPVLTDTWYKEPSGCQDLRQCIHPKPRMNKKDSCFHPVPYLQVFQERYGFIPNLSIIDLLFNEGPQAVSILRRSVTSDE
jgi:hypothetical protein